jgi:hypothetical protein
MRSRSLSILLVVVAAASGIAACGGGAGSGSTPAQTPTPTPTTTTLIVPMGVDYGLKRQCIRSPFPAEPNFYVDNADCPGGSYPSTAYWLNVVEIENNVVGGGTPCIGGSSQSVLFNVPGGLAHEAWQGNSSTGYTLEFNADYSAIANLCTPPTWSFAGIVDNDTFSNAPFPRPDQAMLQFDATFNETNRGAGAVHAGVEMATSWLAAGLGPAIQVSTDVELWDNPNGLGCGAPPNSPPDILCSASSTDPTNGITYYSTAFDGSKLNPPIQTVPGMPTHVVINWGAIIAHAIAEGLYPPPMNGWANSQAGTRQSNDSALGFEIRNDIVGAGGPSGDLKISNYRLYAQVTEQVSR